MPPPDVEQISSPPLPLDRPLFLSHRSSPCLHLSLGSSEPCEWNRKGIQDLPLSPLKSLLFSGQFFPSLAGVFSTSFQNDFGGLFRLPA